MANNISEEPVSHDLSSLLSSEDRDFLIGDQVKVDSLKGKVVGLYFSASWCGPCRRFTPTLVKVYEELSVRDDFEVIFISSDRDEESFDSYFSKMPWLSAPFLDLGIKKHLKDLSEVRGIPHLVILDKNGKVSTTQGVGIIYEYGVNGYPFTPERILELKEEEERALRSILVHESRDFLISNVGSKVKIDSLKGKVVGLYFSASWRVSCRHFTPTLVKVYEELSERDDFEVIFISSDRDEESFNSYFSNMPWLSVPFLDLGTKKHLKDLFKVRGIPHLVILDKNGKVSTTQGVGIIYHYGVNGYPFTPERILELEKEEERAKREQSLRSILVHESRDFLISNAGSKVPVSELEGKTVGLYFASGALKGCLSFTRKLKDVYKNLRDKGENFEVVLVSLDDEGQDFKDIFDAVPWLALPFEDKNRDKLVKYFEVRGIPRLVVIGPDGKTLQSDIVETIEEHGIEAYPFTPEKFAELALIEKAKLEAQTLESILVSSDKDYVISTDGSKVPVAELVGKNILLYFSAHWCPPCRAFLPDFITIVQDIQTKGEPLEVIFISSDHDQSSFDDYFSTMPWLALPFGDDRKALLQRRFKIKGIPAVVAIGPNGRTVSTQVRQLIQAHGADAYPFTDEHVKSLEQKLEDMAKEWPEKVKHELHADHELELSRKTGYVCDGCQEMGHGWSYFCEGCDFDLHPKCALKEKEKAEVKEGYVCDGDVCRKA